MFTILSMAVAGLTAPVAAAPANTPSAIITRWVRETSTDRPRVNVWLDRDDIYHSGDQARVYFKSDQDAYITIVRIDTDGRMRILFPIDPWEDNWARGGRTFEVLGRDRDEAFRVDDYPGVGYIFAIASVDPFKYDDVIRGDHWDYRTISDGRVRGDPYVALSDLADRIAQEGEYDYDVAQYYVDRHYDYPRFLCYDCHTYVSWRYWDPYGSYCSRFRIVIYDDWYYYPYRGYRGRGVIVRPYRPAPRYVFKDADKRNDYVSRVAERPRDAGGDRRSPIERDRTSADVGGRGTIPAPASPRRRVDNGGRDSRTAPAPRQPSADDSPNRDSRRQPDAGRPGDQGPTREAPRPSEGDRSRRPNNSDAVQARPGIVDRSAEPRRPEPERREPSRSQPQDRPQAREPSRPEPRREPAARPAPSERPRAEPRSAPAPRSTGEPDLKRRRPN
jgi:hypothetical protein